METVFLVLVTAYILLPMGLSSLMKIFVPLMNESYRFFSQQIIIIFIWLGMFAGLAKIYYPQNTRGLLKPLGLLPDKPFSYYLLQSVLLLLSLAGIVVILNLISWGFHIHPDNPYREIPTQQLQALSLFAVITAPVLEELIFRGFIQSTLHKYYSPGWAILITSAIFTLFHTAYSETLTAQIYVFLLGILFSLFRYRTGSTIPGMIGHLGNNLMASSMLMMI